MPTGEGPLGGIREKVQDVMLPGITTERRAVGVERSRGRAERREPGDKLCSDPLQAALGAQLLLDSGSLWLPEPTEDRRDLVRVVDRVHGETVARLVCRRRLQGEDDVPGVFS